MLRLLRFSALNAARRRAAPGSSVGFRSRAIRPPPGSSTRTTSAPRSPSTIVQNGPGAMRDRSMTLIPSNAIGIALSSSTSRVFQNASLDQTRHVHIIQAEYLA